MHTGQLVNAALLERGLLARVTPLKPAGHEPEREVGTNRSTTSAREPGSRHISHSPYGTQKTHSSGRSSAATKPNANARWR